MNRGLIVLFDYDSMVYKAVYRICSLADIRGWFNDSRSKEWMKTEIINLAINRLANMGDGVLLDIENVGVDILMIEYFMTVCPKSKRKLADPNYKANRKKRRPIDKWVSLVRKALIEMDFAGVHPEWEADDLIKERAVEIGKDGYVICSIDKDLKQIPGIHFDYYRPQSDELDQWGNRVIMPCRGLDIMTEKESEEFLAIQLLMGDSIDNIKGIPGIGKVKAKKIIEESEDYETTVLQEYINYFDIEEGIKQFDLHRLLIGLGIDNRP